MSFWLLHVHSSLNFSYFSIFSVSLLPLAVNLFKGCLYLLPKGLLRQLIKRLPNNSSIPAISELTSINYLFVVQVLIFPLHFLGSQSSTGRGQSPPCWREWRVSSFFSACCLCFDSLARKRKIFGAVFSPLTLPSDVFELLTFPGPNLDYMRQNETSEKPSCVYPQIVISLDSLPTSSFSLFEPIISCVFAYVFCVCTCRAQRRLVFSLHHVASGY